jgi:hypothetical protein
LSPCRFDIRCIQLNCGDGIRQAFGMQTACNEVELWPSFQALFGECLMDRRIARQSHMRFGGDRRGRALSRAERFDNVKIREWQLRLAGSMAPMIFPERTVAPDILSLF